MQNKEIIEAPVTFSESALQEIARIYERENIAEKKQHLRVGVKGGGCSGLSYVLAFDDATNFDQHFEIQGIPMIMDKRHAIYLLGMHIDYQDGLNARGFTFSNPNAKQTCGCGSSFST
ncbi:MAG: iron-sulfur cluster assembly accessory protein [Bacteroidia bacterium]|nr:iron-sulfur cluster assembly accessory protein [Bacteroidia bacterium]MDW8159685.1 iron-sulfur cluster assembly accessory protein [Bacteroidia bacterium]